MAVESMVNTRSQVKALRPPQGSSPGTLVFANDARQPRITVITYDQTTHQTLDVSRVEELAELPIAARKEPSGLLASRGKGAKKGVTWIDIQGLGDEATLRQVSQIFGIHRLTIADIVNVPQRPKVEEHEGYLLVLTVMASTDPQKMKVQLEQIGIVLGDGYVVTFQHEYGDVFDPIRKRIDEGKGPIRKQGSDYLAYALLDAVVDGYYPVLEEIGEELEDLENEVVGHPSKAILKRIYRTKREMLSLRRAVWPQRDALNSLARDDNDFIKKNVRVYFRDTYEHLAQVIDIIETYRELTGGFMDIYLSSISNRMNEVMQVLTLIATIFIPLSFIAGVYGMNFEYMPELKMRWAYPIFWLAILAIIIGMVTFFVKKGWLRFEPRERTLAQENTDTSTKDGYDL